MWEISACCFLGFCVNVRRMPHLFKGEGEGGGDISLSFFLSLLQEAKVLGMSEGERKKLFFFPFSNGTCIAYVGKRRRRRRRKLILPLYTGETERARGKIQSRSRHDECAPTKEIANLSSSLGFPPDRQAKLSSSPSFSKIINPRPTFPHSMPCYKEPEYTRMLVFFQPPSNNFFFSAETPQRPSVIKCFTVVRGKNEVCTYSPD